MKGMVLNIEGVRQSDKAEMLLKREKPDIAGFLQAYHAEQSLRRAAVREGYYPHHLDGDQEHRNIFLMIRKDADFEILSVRPMFMDEEWIGGKAGHHHEPRVYWKVVLRKGNQIVTRVVILHQPTDNSTRAQEETKDRLIAYRRRHLDDDCVFLGDFNEEVHEVQSLVRRLQGKRRTAGKVDHGIFSPAREGRLARESDLRCSVESLRKWMQDGAHGWGIYSWHRAPAR